MEMKNYYGYLSLLLDEGEIPPPHQVSRIYMYHTDNGVLRNLLGLFLDRKYYRKYFIKIRTGNGGVIIRRVRQDAVPLWSARIAEINSEIYHSKIQNG